MSHGATRGYAGLRGATRGYAGLLKDEGTIRAGLKSMARHSPRSDSCYISTCPGHPFLLQLLYLHPHSYSHQPAIWRSGVCGNWTKMHDQIVRRSVSPSAWIIILLFGMANPALQHPLRINAPTYAPPGSSQFVDHAFPGFAIETSDFQDYAGNKTIPNTFSRNLVRGIADRTGEMPIIRVGGSTAYVVIGRLDVAGSNTFAVITPSFLRIRPSARLLYLVR